MKTLPTSEPKGVRASLACLAVQTAARQGRLQRANGSRRTRLAIATVVELLLLLLQLLLDAAASAVPRADATAAVAHLDRGMPGSSRLHAGTAAAAAAA